MHQHFTDMFNGRDLGVAERVLFVDGVGGPGSVPTKPGNSPAADRPEPKPADKPADKKSPEVKDGPNGPRDAVGGAQKIEQGKPGALPAPVAKTPEAKKAVEDAVADGKVSDQEKGAIKDGSKSEVLREVKENAEGWLGDAGRKQVHADNLDRVKSENHDTARKNLEDGKAAGLNPAELTDLTERVAAADKAEGEIVGVVQAKQKLIGANEAEIVQLDGTRSPDAAAWKNKDTQQYKDAVATTQRFQDAGGQVYEPDMFGDDWDSEKGWDFEQIAKKYGEDPQRWKNDFVGAQGDGTSLEDRKRRTEAGNLLTALESYTAAKDENAAVDGQIADRRARIDDLAGQIRTDTEHLSGDRKAALSGPGIDAPAEPATTNGKPSPSAADNADKRSTTEPQAPQSEDPKSKEHQINAPAPGDLARPENRGQLLEQGVAKGVIPQNVQFNDQGQAVYTVQDGDSYWSITERLNNNTFDPEIWNSTMQSNAQLLDRTGSPDIINVGDQIVVPYFTQQRYAELLQQQ